MPIPPTWAGGRQAFWARGWRLSSPRVAALGVSELTCEANPDSLTDSLLEGLARAGPRRLSVGVQSLEDAELAELGRLHDAACAKERVAAPVASGLDVSCDLMCATPSQTDASWGRTLGQAGRAWRRPCEACTPS